MKEIVLQCLQALIKSKKDKNQMPSYILDVELRNSITEIVYQAIRELWKEKKIQVGRTINNNYIEIVTKENKNKQKQIIHK